MDATTDLLRCCMYQVRHRSHTCFQLYEVLLPTLQAPEVVGFGAGFTTPQRAGTCYAKCVFLALRTLLAEFGVPKRVRRHLMFNMRLYFLENMVKDLDTTSRSSELTTSDRIVLTVALKQVARRCVRDEDLAKAVTRAHMCLHKIWLAAPPMRWLGLLAREPSDWAPVTMEFQGNSGFGGFRMEFLSALVPPDVRTAFAGPTSSKASNPHVDLTGIASAEAAAGGPSLEALTQALLMCEAVHSLFIIDWQPLHKVFSLHFL